LKGSEINNPSKQRIDTQTRTKAQSTSQVITPMRPDVQIRAKERGGTQFEIFNVEQAEQKHTIKKPNRT